MEDKISIATKLVNLSATIMDIYNLMASLECEGQKDSLDYSILKAKAQGIISQEDEIYEELKEDIKGAYAINGFLFPLGILCLPDELEFIKRQDIDDLVKARVGRKISDIVLTAPFTYEEMEDDDEEEEEVEEQQFDEFEFEVLAAENPEEEFQKECELTIAVETDIINTILSLLASYSTDEEFKDIQEGLIHFKYYLAFMYPEVEKTLVSSSFNNPSCLVWTSYFTGDMQAESTDNTKVLIREYIMDIISNQLDAYYDVADEKDSDIKKLKMTFTEIILRASMIFFSDGEIRDIKELADQDLKNLSNEPDINNSLNRVFKSRQADSSLPLVLSLHPRFPETK